MYGRSHNRYGCAARTSQYLSESCLNIEGVVKIDLTGTENGSVTQSAYSCTVCLLMHSMHSTLTYAQPSCTVYKDVMDTHFQ